MNRVTPKFYRNFACRMCAGNIEEAVEQEEKLCDEVETVREFTYLGDKVSAVEDVRRLYLSVQDVVGLSLWSAVSCCMAGDFLQS